MNLPENSPRPPRPLSTKEGWRDYVSWHERERSKPGMPTDPRGMTPEERRRFDELRHEHHNSFGPILTPQLVRLNGALCELAAANLRPTSGARPGAVIDGLANIGKTTTLTHFGAEYELALRKRYGEQMATEHGAEWHPVVYHTLSAPTTVKAMNVGLAHFYNALVPRTATTQRLTEVVIEHAQRCATTLFLVDDIHYLDLRHQPAREVNNHLKLLANETSATFVYAGIGCLNLDLFSEGQPKHKESFGQTRGRFSHFPIGPFGTHSEAAQKEWQNLVKAFENELVLLKGHEGMCTSIAAYLYERTGGFVGSLSALLRRGAARAIETGQERITRRLLETVRLDHAAETGRPGRRRRKGGGGR